MAQHFSDPLTSVVYTSPSTHSKHDPLLAPVAPTASVSLPIASQHRPATPTGVAEDAKTTNIVDPLSASAASKSSVKSRVSPAGHQKLLSPRSPSSFSKEIKTSGTSKEKHLSNVSSFSSPSSPLPRPFSDPLLGADSKDIAPESRLRNYGPTESRINNNSSTMNDPSFRATSRRGSLAGVSSSTPNLASPVFTTDTESKADSPPPRISRRESSYDQQRVKAPQYLHITISDTDRRGKDGMFVLSAKTNMPRYKRQSYHNITRSYLEFLRLREHLLAEHPETIVPVLPPERSLVIASDIQSMRRFLERVSHHPVLSQDYELQMFIESEFGFLPPVKPKRILGRLLNISVKRFSSGAGPSASLDDTDDEFEEERTAAAKLESKLQTVIKCLEKEIKARRDFSSKESELATLSNAWATSESSPELARTFKQLAKPLDGMAKASKAQVGGDATVMGSFLEYKLQHVQTLSGALDYRLSVLSEYDAAIKSTESKRRTMERLRSSTNINPEKVTDSIDDLEDAVLFEGNMKKRMEQISAALTKDLEGYKHQSQEDLLRALQQYSQRQIGFERAKLEELLSVGAGLHKIHLRDESRTSNGSYQPPASWLRGAVTAAQ